MLFYAVLCCVMLFYCLISVTLCRPTKQPLQKFPSHSWGDHGGPWKLHQVAALAALVAGFGHSRSLRPARPAASRTGWGGAWCGSEKRIPSFLVHGRHEAFAGKVLSSVSLWQTSRRLAENGQTEGANARLLNQSYRLHANALDNDSSLIIHCTIHSFTVELKVFLWHALCAFPLLPETRKRAIRQHLPEFALNRGDTDEELLQQAASKNSALDMRHYVAAINKSARAGAPEKADACFRELRSARLDPDIFAYTAVINAHARTGDAAGAQRWFKDTNGGCCDFRAFLLPTSTFQSLNYTSIVGERLVYWQGTQKSRGVGSGRSDGPMKSASSGNSDGSRFSMLRGAHRLMTSHMVPICSDLIPSLRMETQSDSLVEYMTASQDPSRFEI